MFLVGGDRNERLRVEDGAKQFVIIVVDSIRLPLVLVEVQRLQP